MATVDPDRKLGGIKPQRHGRLRELMRRLKRARSENVSPLPVSEVLIALIHEDGEDQIVLGRLMIRLRELGHALLLLLLALPNLVPVPVPLMSVLTGPLLLVFSIQMLLGWPYPHLPRRFARASVSHGNLAQVLRRALPYVQRLERWLKPRHKVLFSATGRRVAGVVLVALSLYVLIPFPLTNWFPALAIALYALGLLERDGRMVVFAGLAAVWALLFVSSALAVLFDVGWKILGTTFAYMGSLASG